MIFWEKGRQNTGYEKLTLIKKGFKLGRLSGFDLHLIKYNDGNHIPPHVDAVDENNHYRCNFILKNAKSGGEFHCEKYTKFWRFIFFRPDLHLIASFRTSFQNFITIEENFNKTYYISM